MSSDAIAPLAVAVLRAIDLPADVAGLFSLTPEALFRDRGVTTDVQRFGMVTCERVMLVQWGDPMTASAVLRDAVRAAGVPVRDAAIVRHVGVEAVRHLLRVAAGLESSRVGEQEILGQLRTAWANAWAAERPHPMFDRVLQQVIGASRYVRAALPPPDAVRSLGEEAVAAVDSVLGSVDWAARRALVIGTGSAATSALSALRRVGPASLSVIGRTPARVRAVARRFDATAYWWPDLADVVAAHEVVIFAVRSATPIVETALAPASSDAVWVDLGIPPLASPRAGVRYVGLSALHAAIDADPERMARGRRAVEVELARVVMDLAQRQVA